MHVQCVASWLVPNTVWNRQQIACLQGGESQAEVAARVIGTINQIAASHPGKALRTTLSAGCSCILKVSSLGTGPQPMVTHMYAFANTGTHTCTHEIVWTSRSVHIQTWGLNGMFCEVPVCISAGQTILLILHGGVLHACHRHAVGHEFQGRNVNCAINVIKIEVQRWAMIGWNDAKHLQGTGFMTSASGGGGEGG